ncbi:MAG TPA: 4Fe-4S binding protein [bacterium]|nr:4Fe-4S binding protein [bacterium]
MNCYEKLREKLDLFPVGMPKSTEAAELLQLLFGDDDILVASNVPNPPLMFSAKKIARKSGVGKEEAAARLQSLAARGLIMEYKVLGEPLYTLLPAVPGFIEMQFMPAGPVDEKKRRAGELWRIMMGGELGKENHGYPTSGIRVIPIKKSVDTTQKVFNFEETEKIIRASGTIAIADCACRKAVGKCSAPLDVCMMFNVMADYLIEKNMARKATLKEAVKALERAEDAGLVHTTANSKPPIQIICNCCSCCCMSLWGVTNLGKAAGSVSSNFSALVQDESVCIKCGMCAKVCPMGAITVTEDLTAVNTGKCIGCGLCAHKCPTGAMVLSRKSESEPPTTTLHLAAKMSGERNKLPRMINNLTKEIF